MHDPTEHVQEHITHEAAHGGHDAEHHGPRWITAAALTAAILAAFAAVTGTLATEHLTESMLRRIMANDTWSQYQSKSLKNYTLESTDALLETMSPAAGMAAGTKSKIAKDQAKHTENENDKVNLSHSARANEELSEAHLHSNEIFEFAATLFHISIAVVAIAVVAKRREFWYMSMVSGVVGVAFFIYAFMPYHPPTQEEGAPTTAAAAVEHPPGKATGETTAGEAHSGAAKAPVSSAPAGSE